MQLIQRKLFLQFWLPIVICLVLIVLYENEVLEPAVWQGFKVNEYYAAIVMELVTICLIPLSLRLFKFGFVKRSFTANGPDALLRWGTVRMDMLTVPMMVNTFLYYQFMNVAFGYMGIILLLCMMFVYPSRRRCEDESGLSGSKPTKDGSKPTKDDSKPTKDGNSPTKGNGNPTGGKPTAGQK